jgi:hypothetical protein
MSGFRLINHVSDSAYDGAPVDFISDESELLDRLERVMMRNNVDFTFYSPDNDQLWIAVAGDYGWVEFIAKSGAPPYLCAVRSAEPDVETQPPDMLQLPLLSLSDQEKETHGATRLSQAKETLITFNIGGTSTPVPVSQCVSAKDVVLIILHYYRHQELPNEFRWEEIKE